MLYYAGRAESNAAAGMVTELREKGLRLSIQLLLKYLRKAPAQPAKKAVEDFLRLLPHFLEPQEPTFRYPDAMPRVSVIVRVLAYRDTSSSEDSAQVRLGISGAHSDA